MYWEKFNDGWYFKRGTFMMIQALGTGDFGEPVQLPHDYMISGEVRKDAPAAAAMGYFTDGAATYTRFLEVPADWKGQRVVLYFDGAMLNASVSVNGCFCKLHHYGYTPFTVDITEYLRYGESNRIAVVVNPSMQPNSRWYTGAGLFREMRIAHGAPIHAVADGIFVYTTRLEGVSAAGDGANGVSDAGASGAVSGEAPDGAAMCAVSDTAARAFLVAEVTVENHLPQDRRVRVQVSVRPAAGQIPCGASRSGQADTAQEAPAGTVSEPLLIREGYVLVKAGESAAARIPMTMKDVRLWDAEHPELYALTAEVEDQGAFYTHLESEGALGLCDRAQTRFGVRTVTADAESGLRVNGRSVKLRGGCIHHDNGLLGAVSLYDSEIRKLRIMKEAGFNAVRLAHNPPSSVLLEACDELGMYVFNEAFDAWNIAKQPGDYSQFFAQHWKEDMAAFIRRDRNHPSILIWSTGNEVEERGGMGDGYATARELAEYVRSLDGTRLVTNGLCSMWSGLDDHGVREQLRILKERGEAGLQNTDAGAQDTSWEEITEPFANCLDVVGYNYMDNHYEYDGERYPERVILGTESFPNQIDKVWAFVEKLPYVIGDFTWTSWDYIGEAGIGKSVFLEKDDPRLAQGAMAVSSHTSEYPWRLANDADFTISGRITPQGVYRRIVWGSEETGLFTQHPERFGLEEVVSSWGWNEMSASWNYQAFAGKPVKVYVYSRAQEVELFLNGVSLGRKPAGQENRYTAVYETAFAAGTLEAVSYDDGAEVSRASIVTTGATAALRLVPEREELRPDAESLCYVSVEAVDEEGRVVPDAVLSLTAAVSHEAEQDETAQATGEAAQSADKTAQSESITHGTADAAVLAGFGSDAPVTEDNYTAGRCVSYQGRAMAILRAGSRAGEAVLRVSAPGLPEAQCRIAVR